MLDPTEMQSWFNTYCDGEIEKMPQLKKFSTSIKKQISSRISKKADGNNQLHLEPNGR